MRDLLPENGASAIGFRDPQTAAVVAECACANPRCRRLIYRGDRHELYDDLHFCDESCFLAWLRSEGELKTVYAGEEN